MEPGNPFFHAENLAFGFGHRFLFTHVGFSSGPGKITCLLGVNGSGKSTLLKLCAGLVSPQQGRVRVLGKDLARCVPEERAALVAYQGQRLVPLGPLSVRDFMGLTHEFRRQFRTFEANPHRDSDTRDETCLELFHALPYADSDIGQLSGGEWARVQTARVWAQDAPLLILDEPDAALDPGHKRLLALRCREFVASGERGILMTTHDLNFGLAVATEAVLLAERRLVWGGPVQKLWTSGFLEKLYGVEIARFERGAAGELGAGGNVLSPIF